MSQSGTSASSLPGNIAKRFRAAREKRGKQDDYWDEVLEMKKAAELLAKAKKRARFTGSSQRGENQAVDEPCRKAPGGLERYQLEVSGGVFVSGRRSSSKRKLASAEAPIQTLSTNSSDVDVVGPQNVEFQRLKMVALYERCNPTKVYEVDALLNRYLDQHPMMWMKLEEKYGSDALATAHAAALEREATFKAMEVAKRMASQPAPPETASSAPKKKRRKDIVRVRVRGQALTPKKKKVKKDLSYSKWRSMSKNERKAYNRP